MRKATRELIGHCQGSTKFLLESKALPGLKRLPVSKPMTENAGKATALPPTGDASLADWEPSGKGDGIGGWIFFVSTVDEVRCAG
jgi:hypothetical protein